MKTEREFESILAALGERELSDWERQRLWKLIAEDETRLPDYLAICQVDAALKSLAAPNVVPSGIGIERPHKARKRHLGLAVASAAAAAVVILGAAAWAKLAGNSVDEVVESVAPEPVTPEESYRSMLAEFQAAGSKQRPPTQFVSLQTDGVPEGPILFNEHVRPILSEHCYACHGPDSSSRKADLRLDTREGAAAVIKPGDVADSELVSRILHDDPDEVMPPPDSHKVLKPEHKQILGRWIAQGAEWEEHWAFNPPARPADPKLAKLADWVKNPIDNFVLAKLLEIGLAPNEEAQRHDLARRAALDITGLPPDEKLREEFAIDTRPDAYEHYVRALLESEHAGEHQARFWLDAARYGDTHGMHLDNYREIWPYRDWVIDAFNANMPFDRFTIEQIAGDLLPNATLQQRIATGFGRCNITTSEGGAIPEELSVRYMIDRVETTSTVFLGLTLGCAVCHDHKFDPISQREFYRLAAFYNNTTQPAMDGNQKDTPPVVVLPGAEFEDEWERLRTLRAGIREDLKKARTEPAPAPAAAVVGEHPVATDGLLVSMPLAEGSIELPPGASWETAHPAGKRGLRFEKGSPLTAEFPASNSNQPLSVSFWIRTADELVGATVFDQTSKIDGKEVGWKITTSVQGALTFDIHDAKGKKIQGLLPGDEALTPRTWQHVAVRYSGGQSSSSLTIAVNGRIGRLRNASESYIEATELPANPVKIAPDFPTGGLSDIRIFNRWIGDEEMELLAREFELRAEPQSTELLAVFHANVLNRHYLAKSRELAETQNRRDYIYSRSTSTLVMQERPGARPRAWVLERGEYDRRGDEVEPGVPAVLPQLPPDSPANRLALANWIASGENPLTARVTVNRLWQSFFGTGLVKTAEDFGVMGERPVNQQLLDWLAVEFVESGWDVNHMIELMTTSAAYRQSIAIDPDKLRIDPENRYLARGPRHRLDAEVLRDQALAVSGLLRRDIGGPSVKPYQPAGVWKVVAFAGSNTRDFKPDTGDALYRRSLYTFWKRTSPPPSMAAFNAPTRESCTVRRERTNTPLQALVLMNDPQFVEAARALAERALKITTDDQARAAWMVRTVFARPANASDLADMVSAAAEFRAIFAADLEAAQDLISTGESKPDATLDAAELAAWTMISNTLMNRDDFINKS